MRKPVAAKLCDTLKTIGDTTFHTRQLCLARPNTSYLPCARLRLACRGCESADILGGNVTLRTRVMLEATAVKRRRQR